MTVVLPRAVRHAAALLDGVREPTLVRGYLDVLGDVPPAPTGLAQSLMLTSLVPAIYERWWRPILGQAAKGPFGLTESGERQLAREYLRPMPGDVVVDVACGPGNFTRPLAEAVGERGLAIGVDASSTMLERAVWDTRAANIAYLRADATDLPLRPGSVDAIGCFMALHLFADPATAVRRMAQALAPGGRIALFATCDRGHPLLRRLVVDPFARPGGIHLFGRDELTDCLSQLGFREIRQEVHGFLQFVGACRPTIPRGAMRNPREVFW